MQFLITGRDLGLGPYSIQMMMKIARTVLIAATMTASATLSAQTADSATASAASDGSKPPYTVVDGYKVDAETLKGFRTWRAAACDRCHGPNQEGLVGPSLIESLKTLSKADVYKTLHDGRLEKGMPSWSANKQVMDNFDQLYAYLKGRSDGAITRAHVEPMPAP